ncbi:MAG: MFS transporter [Candidatus Lokiarchaeota archaeon]|nr:MFS transporter [Candidatus Lokiarchaeota archaeon]
MAFINRKYSRRRTFIGLSSFQLLAMFRRGMFYTYLSQYMIGFLGLPVTIATLYATLPMFISVVFQNFVWGPISDKTQRRRTLIILGEVLAGIGTLIVWFIHSIFVDLFLAGITIIIGLTFIEAFWSMSNISWSALISDIYPSKDRSKIMGQLTSVGGFGRMIGISIGSLLFINGYGFRYGPLFFVAALVMFISSIPMLLTPEGGVNSEIEPESENVHKNNKANTPRKLNFKFIFVVFIISLAFINFGRNSIATTYSPYLYLPDGFAVNDFLMGFIANTRSLATLIIGFLAGTLSKKFGHSRALIFGASLAIIALVITGTTNNLVLIFIGSFFIGTAEVIILASSYVIASNLIPYKVRARLFGAYNATFFLSWGLAGTIISGPIIDFLLNTGFNDVISFRVAFIVGALITGIGLVIFVILEIWLKPRNTKTYKN